jgi:hypothetical protein
MHVPDIHWIVADDNQSCNAMVAKLLKKFGKFIIYSYHNKTNFTEDIWQLCWGLTFPHCMIIASVAARQQQ